MSKLAPTILLPIFLLTSSCADHIETPISKAWCKYDDKNLRIIFANNKKDVFQSDTVMLKATAGIDGWKIVKNKIAPDDNEFKLTIINKGDKHFGRCLTEDSDGTITGYFFDNNNSKPSEHIPLVF